MNIKKYLTKELIKLFFISVTLDFLFITAMVWLMTTIFSDGFPKPLGTWLSIILMYSIGDGVRHVKTVNMVNDMSELTKSNYWRLKKELRTKVNKRDNHGNK